MRWATIWSLLTNLGLFPGINGYGTTIFITTCPASSTLATGTGSPIPTFSPTPVLIYVEQSLVKRADLQYVSSLGGTLNSDPENALIWIFTANGELMSDDGRFISTSSLEPFRFFPSTPKLGISTLWEVSANRTVLWNNWRFPTGRANFCLRGSNVWIYFNQPPAGCSPVALGAIPKDDVIPPVSGTSRSTATVHSTVTSSPETTSPSPSIVYGTLANAEPVGCLVSPIGSLALNSPNSTVLNLEQCVDICAAYISTGIDYHYVGAQFGNQCYCGLSLDPTSALASAGACNLPCSGNSSEICGGNTAMSVLVIVSRTSPPVSTSVQASTTSIGPSGTGYPTTTGEPNCFDNSDFDGTVNDNYLILCDTDLPGFDLSAVAATDLAGCIEQCNSYVPSGNDDTCVAVEYDILAAGLPCKLKNDVGQVNRGANIFAQAAILVELPGAPTIVFGTITVSATPSSTAIQLSSSTSSTTILSTTNVLSSAASRTSMPSVTSSSPPSIPSLSYSASTRSITATTTTTTTTMTTSTSTSKSVSRVTNSSGPSPSTLILSSTTSSPARSLSSAISASSSSQSFSFATTTGFPTPTATHLCPTYNHQVLNVNSDDYPYEVECGATLVGNVLNDNSTTAASLSDCISFCTLYNIALPYECFGVNFLGTSQGSGANCFLLGSITGTICLPGTDAGRLIWPQYPAATDQLCVPTPSTTSAVPGSSTTRPSSSLTSSPTAGSQSTVPSPSSSSTTPSRPVSSSTSSSAAASSPAPSSSSSPTLPISPTSSSRPAIPSSSSTSPSSTNSQALSSPATTSIRPSSSSSTSLTSTTPYTQTPCPAAPTGTDGYTTECPSPTPTPNPNPSPQCYYYNFTAQSYPSSNYEVECSTSFTGASLAPGLNIDLHDCIYYCQYANYLGSITNPNGPPACVGVTFDESQGGQGGNNNCFRYSSITCASRGNATFDSARLLFAGYPSMVDYGAGFSC